MSVALGKILTAFPPLDFVGDESAVINRIVQLDPANTSRDVLCWCNAKNTHKLAALNCGTIIMPSGTDFSAFHKDCNYILVDNPRQYFNYVLTEFFWKPDVATGISASADIAANAVLGKDIFVGANVVISENCVIGDKVRIQNNTFIYPGTVIEHDVLIGANNVIGNYGFGYEKDNAGNNVLMPHIGNVIIRSHAEIGNNNCIDRSVLGSTVVGSYTKIHNFVQVAHGVTIGCNCLVAANVTISGSTDIGNDVWLGPGATISNKLKIGNLAHLAMGTVVLADVPEGATVVGNPGRIIKTMPK